MRIRARFISTPLFALVAVVGFSPPASANTLLVPSQFATIQAAIDAALPGDTVLVAPGIYVQGLDFLGKNITVMSEAGPEVTILEASIDWTVVQFVNGETRDAVLHGFTIRNGKGACTPSPNIALGGGVYIENSSPTISGNIIRDNTTTSVCTNAVTRGGGGLANRGGDPLVIGNTFRNNTLQGTGDRLGCAIYTRGGGEFVDNLVELHTSTGTYGGAIFVRSGTPLIRDNTLRDNTASFGGAIYLGGSSAEVRNNRIENNRAVRGGGICADDVDGFSTREDSLVLRNTIRGNTASRGGGIFIDHAHLTVRLNTIVENEGFAFGGGIGVDRGGSLIRRNRILRNESQAGAGMLLPDRSGEVSNNIIAQNAAVSTGGGVYVFQANTSSPNVLFTHNTIFGNTASAGGAIHFTPGTIGTIENSILYENLAVTDPTLSGDLTQVTIRYSDIEGGFAGEGNIDADPRLVAPGADDYRLRLGSPCIDAADLVSGAQSIDEQGDPRPIDGDLDTMPLPDIGADELVPEHAALFGSVNAGLGDLTDVLLVNGSAGDDTRSLAVEATGPIVFEMLLPPTGGSGKFVVHADAGSPTPSTIVSLPAGVGWTGFPFLVGDGASPIAGFNNLGKEAVALGNFYFDGTQTSPPDRAPSVFLDLPAGDLANLPPGTVFTIQGAILDPGTEANKPGSATNGIVVSLL